MKKIRIVNLITGGPQQRRKGRGGGGGGGWVQKPSNPRGQVPF